MVHNLDHLSPLFAISGSELQYQCQGCQGTATSDSKITLMLSTSDRSELQCCNDYIFYVYILLPTCTIPCKAMSVCHVHLYPRDVGLALPVSERAQP